MKPAHITATDWNAMSWHARMRATRHLRPLPSPDAPASAVVTPRHKLRIRRTPSGWWEMTDGVNTVMTAKAEAAWSLLNRVDTQ